MDNNVGAEFIFVDVHMHVLRADDRIVARCCRVQGCPLKFIRPLYADATKQQRLAVQPPHKSKLTFAMQRQARLRAFAALAPVGVEQQLSLQSKVQPRSLRLRNDPNKGGVNNNNNYNDGDGDNSSSSNAGTPAAVKHSLNTTDIHTDAQAMRDDELIEKHMKHFGLEIIPFRAHLKKARLTPSQQHVLGNVAPPNRWRIAICAKWGVLGRGCDPRARGQI